MYDYMNRIGHIKNIFRENISSSHEILKKVNKDTLKSTGASGATGWASILNVHVSINKMNDSKSDVRYYNIISRIQNELYLLFKGFDKEFEIQYHNDGVRVVHIVNYKDDTIKLFTTYSYANTIMKMFSKYTKDNTNWDLRYGIGFTLESGVFYKKSDRNQKNNTFTFISTDTSGIDQASSLSKVNMTSLNKNPMCMSTLFYENAIEGLKKENSEYTNWLVEEYNTNRSIKYFSCNVIIVDFDKNI